MRRRSRKKGVFKRVLGRLGCLGFIAALAVGGYFGYQQIESLLQPMISGGPRDMMATQDVPVERGDVTEMLHIYGTVKTRQEASLGFAFARGKVIAVALTPGQRVSAGQVLVELDEEVLERNLAQAKADLLAAQGALAEITKPPSPTERLRLQARLLQANESLATARRDLATFDAGQDTPQSEYDAADEALADARLALDELLNRKERKENIEFLQWIYNIAEVEHGPYVLISNPSEKDRDVELLLRNDMLDKRESLDAAILQLDIDVKAARRDVAQAARKRDDLGRRLAAGAQEVARLELATAVRVAEDEVRLIQAQLDDLGKVRPDVAIARAEAEVLKKGWLVTDAESAVADAKLVAPFGGVVEQVTISVGDMVSSAAPLVSMLDPLDLYVEAQVSDMDIDRIQPGQAVDVSFDAFRDEPPLAGAFGEIPSFGQYQNGVTIFGVPVTFEDPDVGLMVGMSANLALPLEIKRGVLVIPAMAVSYDRDGAYVRLVRGEDVEQQPVRLGTSDGMTTEVLEGLSEGDVIRVPMYGPIGPYYFGG